MDFKDIGLFTMIAIICVVGSIATGIAAWCDSQAKRDVMAACLAHHTVVECKELR